MKMSGRASLKSRSASGFSRRSYSLLRGTVISRHPAACSFSTTNDPRKPLPPLTTTRLLFQKLILSLLLLRSLTADGLHHARHGILPAVPVADFFFQNRLALSARREPGRFDGRIHHDGHKIAESDLRLPAKFRAGFARIGDEHVHFPRPQVTIGHFDVLLPIQACI